MRDDIAGVGSESSGPTWEVLEAWVRERAQALVQGILEEEVTELLGRRKWERKGAVDAPAGYRNGYGKPRRAGDELGDDHGEASESSGTGGAVREPGAAPVLAENERGGRAAPGVVSARSGGRGLRACDEGPAGRGGSVVEALDPASEGGLDGGVRSLVEEAARRPRDRLHVGGRDLREGGTRAGQGGGAGRDRGDAGREQGGAGAGVRIPGVGGVVVRGVAGPEGQGLPGSWSTTATRRSGARHGIWPEACEQRCWNHKTRNVLDRLPQREQAEAKDLVQAERPNDHPPAVQRGSGCTFSAASHATSRESSGAHRPAFA